MEQERNNFNERHQTLEKELNDLRSGKIHFCFAVSSFTRYITSIESMTNLETIKESYVNAIDELNKELLTIKKQLDEVNVERQRLVDELDKQTSEIHQPSVTKSSLGMFSVLQII